MSCSNEPSLFSKLAKHLPSYDQWRERQPDFVFHFVYIVKNEKGLMYHEDTLREDHTVYQLFSTEITKEIREVCFDNKVEDYCIFEDPDEARAQLLVNS